MYRELRRRYHHPTRPNFSEVIAKMDERFKSGTPRILFVYGFHFLRELNVTVALLISFIVVDAAWAKDTGDFFFFLVASLLC